MSEDKSGPDSGPPTSRHGPRGLGADPPDGADPVDREIRRRSRRSFLVGTVAALAGYGGYRWLRSRPQPDGLPWPFRRSHEFNERVSRAYYRPSRLAPTFPREMAKFPRFNGGEGLSAGFDPATWRLQVLGLADPTSHAQYRTSVAYETAMDNMHAGHASSALHKTRDSEGATRPPADDPVAGAVDRAPAMHMNQPGLLLTLDDIRALPRVELTTELKCIEGWSEVVHWTGVRFADFASVYQPATRTGRLPDVRNRPHELVRYVSLVTPDGGYNVGMDMESALHPQTLLCYDMNGQPLTLEHGAPLRLVTPVKYGIKYIKRIGRIGFTDERPADFWAERGYDWYAGH